MFRGNHPAKVEDTGRIKLPTAFKEILDRMQVSEFYVTSRDGKSAEVWPLPEWEKNEKRLAPHSYMDDEVGVFLEATSFYGNEVKMDSVGRFVLPQLLREAANLSGEVAVLGKTNYLEIFNMGTITQSIKERTMSAEARAKIAMLLVQPV